MDKDTTIVREEYRITSEVWTDLERRRFIEEIFRWPIKKIDAFLEAFGKDLYTKGNPLRRKEEALEIIDNILDRTEKKVVQEIFHHYKAR